MNLYQQIGEENIEKLIDIFYDDIIANDDRLNYIFYNGFENVKAAQKKFFKVFLGAESNVMTMPNLKEAHSKFPISPELASYWQEDFELALDRIDINASQKMFLKQKVRVLSMHMINVVKK